MKMAVALVSLMTLAGIAAGDTWFEFVDGDAGDTVGSAAQVVTGIGDLTAITGFTGEFDMVDAYRFRITSNLAFSATTDFGAGWDTRLLLFNGDGQLLLGQEDSMEGFEGEYTSFLSSPATFIDVFGQYGVDPSAAGVVLDPGEYILAITGYETDPLDAEGNPTIDLEFPDDDYLSLRGVTGGPFVEWGDAGDNYGSYTITLAGAAFIPAPYSLALFGFGGLMAMRRRRGINDRTRFQTR